MSPATESLILQLARENALISEHQIEAARAIRSRNADLVGGSPDLLDVLHQNGELTQPQIRRLLARYYGLDEAQLADDLRVPADVLACVPRDVAARHTIVPLARDERALRLAVSDPLATDTLDCVGHACGLHIDPVIATAEQIDAAIKRLYGSIPLAEQFELSAGDIRATQPQKKIASFAASGEPGGEDEAPVVRLVHAILLKAVQQRASDVHLEPLERRFRVRYRIDGVLQEADSPPKGLERAIVSRVKIMANLSIAEKRLPQDGRIQLQLPDQPLDIRVSTLPTAHGESVVMRILDQRGQRIGLDQLGLDPEDRETLERVIESPDGMVLVTGPTGSGKTTTLYGCLQHLNRSNRKIITVEDPVEYQFTGINQVPVRPECGVTFSTALRAMLRQAPNVIMLGEIRDFDSAEIAIHASLTGHLVFSTLHTNDAAGAVTRLVDLGVKPYLLASSLRAVIAQRLVRKTCEKCAEPDQPERANSPGRTGTLPADRATGYVRGAGCPACRGTGYRGRTGIFEVLVITPDLQGMIHDRASAPRLGAAARAGGMRSLREAGLRKASAGLTTIEEVVSITAAVTESVR